MAWNLALSKNGDSLFSPTIVRACVAGRCGLNGSIFVIFLVQAGSAFRTLLISFGSEMQGASGRKSEQTAGGATKEKLSQICYLSVRIVTNEKICRPREISGGVRLVRLRVKARSQRRRHHFDPLCNAIVLTRFDVGLFEKRENFNHTHLKRNHEGA